MFVVKIAVNEPLTTTGGVTQTQIGAQEKNPNLTHARFGFYSMVGASYKSMNVE